MTDSRSGGPIVFVLYPEQGAFNASYTLARRLREKGRRIVYVVDEAFEAEVARQGFECKTVDWFGESALKRERPNIDKLGRLRGSRYSWRVRVQAYRQTMRDLDAWLAAERPQLILIEPLITDYATPFVKSGVPLLTVNANLASVYNPAVPPVFSRIVPHEPSNVTARARNVLAWSREFIKYLLYQRLWMTAVLRFNLNNADFQALNKRKHLRECKAHLRFGEYWYRLDLPELVLSPSEIDFPCAVDARSRCYAGASVDTARNDGEFDWNRIATPKPLIYCSLGTYARKYRHARRLFHAVIGAAEQLPEKQFLIQAAASLVDTNALPQNVAVFERVPQLEALSRSSLFITQGGFTSVREAMYFGVPLLVFPCWLDQPGNGARVVYHQLGFAGDISTVTTMTILSLINQITSDTLIQESVTRMQKAFQAQEDCQAGVDFVERFLST